MSAIVRPVTRPLVRPLTRRVTERGFGGWSPRVLFAASEQGAWYDPSDLSTLYQNFAGSTPVTALGQPVGLMLDKSQGLVRGPELVTNGDFSQGTTGWTATGGGTLSAASGGLRVTSDADGFSAAMQEFTTVVGRAYEAKALLLGGSATTAGKLYIAAESGTVELARVGYSGPTQTTLRCIFTATKTATRIYIYVDTAGGAYSDFDNVSVKELPGNHATQATGTARPLLAAGNKIDFDGVDDKLTTTFPDLGSNVTIVRSVPSTGASILTAQTIGAGAWDDATDHHGLIIINRALTANETALATAWANQRAGV